MELSGKSILIVEKGIITDDFLNFFNSLGVKITLLNLNNPKPFHYGKLSDKAKNIFHRIFFRDKNYIHQLEYNYYDEYHLKMLKKFLQNNNDFDGVIVIRPDIYSKKFVKKLKFRTSKIVGFMWDGISETKYKRLLKSRKFYDDMFSFNSEDIKNFTQLSLKFAMNFYYPAMEGVTKNKKAVKYVVSDNNKRHLIIDKIITELACYEDFEFDVRILIGNIDKSLLPLNKNINYIRNYIPYGTHLKMMAESNISLDISPSYHKGISFRILESLYFQTKMISTNITLEMYDFYHPNNILIIRTDEDYQKIGKFIQLPFHPLSNKIMMKYRADNWIKNLLDTGDYQKFELPK